MVDEMMRTNGHDLAHRQPQPQRREPERVRTEPDDGNQRSSDDGRQEIIVVVEHNWLWTAVIACVVFSIVFVALALLWTASLPPAVWSG